MKKYVVFIVIATALVQCESKDEKITRVATDTGGYTKIAWIDSIKNIGTIAAGKKTTISFRFKNTGEKPLYIISARPGCGCTVADYPKEAITPHATAVITAEFNAPGNTSGDFRKNIVVTTNTKGSVNHFIFFYGKIQNGKDSANAQKTGALQ